MKEKIKITITLTDDNIVLYGENTQDLTEDDIIDINKMLASLAKTPVFYRKDTQQMKKEVVIKITLTDDNITLDGENLSDMTENDIIDSIKVLVSLAKTMNIIWEGDSANDNA